MYIECSESNRFLTITQTSMSHTFVIILVTPTWANESYEIEKYLKYSLFLDARHSCCCHLTHRRA